MATNNNILKHGHLDLSALRQISEMPPLYEHKNMSFWQDPYVSSHVLEAHLDPDTEAASHPPEVIDRRVNWLCSSCGLVPGRRVLDLGSGPGFYCERFAQLGMRVTGIDYSPASHSYAVECALQAGLDIDYRFGSFVELEIRGSFDLITMIYGDFCTLTKSERKRVLKMVREALSPEGVFAFDVFTREYLDGRPGSPGWYVSDVDGFWRPDEHAVLEQRLEYIEDRVLLDRYLVVDGDGEVSDFRVWNSYFTAQTVSNLIKDAGFTPIHTLSDLAGTELETSPKWIAIVATRT